MFGVNRLPIDSFMEGKMKNIKKNEDFIVNMTAIKLWFKMAGKDEGECESKKQDDNNKWNSGW